MITLVTVDKKRIYTLKKNFFFTFCCVRFFKSYGYKWHLFSLIQVTHAYHMKVGNFHPSIQFLCHLSTAGYILDRSLIYHTFNTEMDSHSHSHLWEI